MTFECPCCGNPINAPPPVYELKRMPLVGIQKVILNSLIGAHPYGIHSDRMLTLLYSHHNEPDYAKTGISVMMGRLREKLKAHGWTIPQGHAGRGHKQVYRLTALVVDLPR